MSRAFLYIAIIVIMMGFLGVRTNGKTSPLLIASADTVIASFTTDTSIPEPGLYSSLDYTKVELLRAAPGTKSVLFNAGGSRLYAMNLEGMSVYEFDRSSRKVVREFKFRPTKGTGWDYDNDKPIPSYQEKPVEACVSDDDKILWVSLHNAEEIVPI